MTTSAHRLPGTGIVLSAAALGLAVLVGVVTYAVSLQDKVAATASAVTRMADKFTEREHEHDTIRLEVEDVKGMLGVQNQTLENIKHQAHVNYTRFEEVEEDLNILTLEVGRHSGFHMAAGKDE